MSSEEETEDVTDADAETEDVTDIDEETEDDTDADAETEDVTDIDEETEDIIDADTDYAANKATQRMTGRLTKYDMVIALFICVSSTLTYYPTFDAEFVWDDRAAIMSNEDVLGTTEWHSVFQHDFWGMNINRTDSHKSYRPLCVLSFRFDYARYGLEAGGYHMWNAMFNGLACTTFYLFTRTLAFQIGPAFIAGVLFALHPVHTEAVAGLVGRADIGACFFMSLALLSYAKATRVAPASSTNANPGVTVDTAAQQGKHVVWVAAAVLFSIVSALFKEIGATVLGLMVAYEVFFILRPAIRLNNRRPRCSSQVVTTDSMVRVGFVCCATAILLKLRLGLHEEATLREWGIVENHIVLSDSRKTRALTIAKSHGRYASLLVWPTRLCYDHGYNATPYVTSFDDPALVEPLVAYLGVVALGLYAVFSDQVILRFSMALTLVPFLPAANVFFYVGTVLAERLLYIPSMGFCLYAGYVLYVPFSSDDGSDVCVDPSFHRETVVTKRARAWCQRYRRPYAALLLLAFGTMGLQTIRRCEDWQNEETIYEAGYREEPESVKVLNNLAQIMLRSGDSKDAARAEMLLDRAIQLDPTGASAWYNRGLAVSTLKRRDESIALMQKAIEMGSASTPNVYAYIAQEYMHIFYDAKAEGKAANATALKQAKIASLAALERHCKMPVAAFTAGNIAFEEGDLEQACLFYERTIRMNQAKYLEPGTELVIADIHNQYALALSRRGLVEEALQQWKMAKRTKQCSYCDINAAGMLASFGRREEAEAMFIRAGEQFPDEPILWNNMGSFYEDEGKYEAALLNYERAFSLNPTHLTIRNNIERMKQTLMHIKETGVRPLSTLERTASSEETTKPPVEDGMVELDIIVDGKHHQVGVPLNMDPMEAGQHFLLQIGWYDDSQREEMTRQIANEIVKKREELAR